MEKITYKDEDKIREYLRKPNNEIAESSERLYFHSLKTILRDLQEPTSIFLDYDKIYKYFNDNEKEMKLTTKRNKILAIIIFLKGVKAEKQLIDKYTMFHDSLTINLNRELYKNKKNKKEEKNWCTMLELEARLDEIKLDIPEQIKTFSDISKYMKYIVGLIQLETGLRNDLADCEIYDYHDYKKIETKTNINYLIIQKRVEEARLILQNYKTKKAYGILDIKISQPVSKQIKLFYNEVQKYKKLRNQSFNWLVFDKYGEKFNRNEYTKLLNNIFNIDDERTVSSGLIRKVILSEKIDIRKLKKQAVNMGHSVQTQLKYYVKENESEASDNEP